MLSQVTIRKNIAVVPETTPFLSFGRESRQVAWKISLKVMIVDTLNGIFGRRVDLTNLDPLILVHTTVTSHSHHNF